MIKIDDALALQAFVEAVDKLEPSLEEGLVESINTVGKCLRGDRSQLIALIRKAYKSHPTLDELYREERQKLWENYQLGERQKGKPPEDDEGAIASNVTENKLIRLGRILEEKNVKEAIKKEKETNGNAWSQILELFMR